jgi:hypothetical protein
MSDNHDEEKEIEDNDFDMTQKEDEDENPYEVANFEDIQKNVDFFLNDMLNANPKEEELVEMPGEYDQLLTNVTSQNRIWNDLCPYDSFPLIKNTLYTVGTAIMNTRKDCHKCKKSFTLDMDSFKFIETEYKTY